jgi:hypothetical protein
LRNSWDRQATTLETWLKQHPGVLLIRRDRAGEFARGAKAGAPEARPPADRFHVLRNLAEVVEKVRGLASPGSENCSSDDHSGNFALPFAPAPASLYERAASNRRGQGSSSAMKLFSECRKQGRSHRAIARQLHLHRQSVKRFSPSRNIS